MKIEELDYLTVRQKQILRKNGIFTVLDLLNLFPERVDDYTLTSETVWNDFQTFTIVGTIISRPTIKRIKQNMTIMLFNIESGGRHLKITIFNRHFFASQLTYNRTVRLRGKFDSTLTNFTAVNIEFDKNYGEIIPVFHIAGISNANFKKIQEETFRRFHNLIVDPYPLELIKEENLLTLKETIENLIKPNDLLSFDRAKYRVKFQELLKYELNLLYLKYQRKNFPKGIKIDVKEEVLNSFIKRLSFTLTFDQKEALKECLVDIRSPYKMNRLLQGEVGSGKTIIAAILFLGIIKEGYQGALMAPTEVLATQHYQTFKKLYKDLGINLVLLTSDVKDKQEILKKLKEGSVNLIIGTHSLFQKDVVFKNLGLVVTDEEQRFGVRQRLSLVSKGRAVDHLKMTATPIPRTLAISKLGDCDLSTLKKVPEGRKKVQTFYLNYDERMKAIEHIHKELKNNHQIYIVTPTIEEAKNLEVNNALEVYNKTKAYFQGEATVGLIHGRMTKEEKDQIMNDFNDNKINILVSTSVIEVGLNVVNATTIIILDADRFGISQLHQLRGRVQRGSEESFCFLISRASSEQATNRLDLVSRCDDGFKLAEADLKRRGRGDLFGERQSGTVYFKLANLLADEDILEKAHNRALNLIESEKLFTDEYQTIYKEIHNEFLMKEKTIE